MVEMLLDEHRVIRPLTERLATLAGEARQAPFTPERWRHFRELAAEIVERLGAHIQKEEMGLLPLLDDVLEEDDDAALAVDYAASR